MLFTSVVYFLFLAGSLLVYYIIPPKLRNYFLIVVSAIFYMYLKAEYLFIILFIIITNYFIGIEIEKAESKTKQIRFLRLSLFVNLGMLIFFKYWNFAVENIFQFFGLFRLNSPIPFLDIALPIGLSYYIFQTIGYITDIYRGSRKAERDFFNFSLFTLFFPKLLVGPIERANHFLPQLTKKIYFDKVNISEGAKRIAWGLFKKLVVADRISIYQAAVMVNSQEQSGSTLFFATVLYTFQVYADFSGYTDIALGTARMFGFDLMENFKRPLLAKNMGDFWRRWHISLSSWVNDYIFNPIALNHRNWGKWGVFYALLISFIVIGIWHGASWNYVVFGLLQAIALIYETVTKKARKKVARRMPTSLYNNLSIIATFSYVSFSLIIFRSASYSEAMNFFEGLFSNPGKLFFDTPSTLLFMLIGCGILLIHDIKKEYRKNNYSLFSNKSWVQGISYALLIAYILVAGVFDGGQFIYFSF